MLFYEHRRTSRTKTDGEKALNAKNGDVDEIRCWVLNEHYAFIVKQASADAEWTLDAFGKPGEDVYAYVNRHMKIFEYTTCFRGVLLMDCPLLELTQNTGFVVLSSSEDRGLTKVEFRFDVPKDKRTSLGLPLSAMEGVVWLDPSHQWRLDSFNLRVAGGTERQTKCKYGPDSRLIVTGREFHTGDFVETAKVNDYSFDDRFAAKEFRLSAFGLPEPEGIETPSNRFWYWYWGVAGILLLFVGAWAIRRQKR